MIYVLHSPLVVGTGKSRFIMNVNKYQRAHYQALSKAKKTYTYIMSGQIRQLPKLKKITIEYVIYPKTAKMFDIDNLVSVQKKFFQDALTKHKKIVDDNYNYIVGSSERFGAIDKENPRVEIIITEVKKNG